MSEIQEKVKVEKQHLLAQWYDIAQQLKRFKDREMILRKELFAYYFPNPLPGTNRVDIGEGFKLEGVYKIDVKMDFKAFDKLLSEQDEDFNLVHKSDVVEYKPEFKETNFKKLNEEQQDFIEQVLTRKPAAPALSIVKAKKSE